MPTVYSLFGPKPSFTDINGAPLNAGRLLFYVSGSTTPKGTYTDSTGTVLNSNPVILDARGEPPNSIYGTTGAYRIVLQDSALNVLWTVDGVMGINDNITSQSEWVSLGLTPTFVNSTTFTVAGDQTATLTPGRRVQTTNTGDIITSTITASSFAASTTTVTVANDSGVLDSGLSAVTYSLLNSTAPSLPFYRMPGVSVASATTVNMTAVSSALVIVSGTTNIQNITLPNGVFRVIKFSGALTLTTGGNLLLQNNANVTVVAGDVFFAQGTALGVEIGRLSSVSNATYRAGIGAAGSGANTDIVSMLSPSLGSPNVNTQSASDSSNLAASTAFVKSVSFGGAQTWQNVTGGRSLSTQFRNGSLRTRAVSGYLTNTGSAQIQLIVNNQTVAIYTAPSGAAEMPFYMLVPPDETYELRLLAGTAIVSTWAELS